MVFKCFQYINGFIWIDLYCQRQDVSRTILQHVQFSTFLLKKKGISCDFLNNFQGTQFWEPRYLRRHRLLELWATRPWRGDISNNELQMYGKLCMTNHTMDIHGVSGWCLIVVLSCFSIFKNPRATNKIQTNQWSTWEVRARTLTWMSATTPSKSCRASKYTWAVYCLGMAQNISK